MKIKALNSISIPSLGVSCKKGQIIDLSDDDAEKLLNSGRFEKVGEYQTRQMTSKNSSKGRRINSNQEEINE